MRYRYLLLSHAFRCTTIPAATVHPVLPASATTDPGSIRHLHPIRNCRYDPSNGVAYHPKPSNEVLSRDAGSAFRHGSNYRYPGYALRRYVKSIRYRTVHKNHRPSAPHSGNVRWHKSKAHPSRQSLFQNQAAGDPGIRNDRPPLNSRQQTRPDRHKYLSIPYLYKNRFRWHCLFPETGYPTGYFLSDVF